MPDSDNEVKKLNSLRNEMEILEKAIREEFKRAFKVHNSEAYLKVDSMIEDYIIVKRNYRDEINKRREFL